MTEDLHSETGPDGDPANAVLAPSIRVVVTPVEGADVAAALASIKRQAYDHLTDVVVVGDGDVDDLEGVSVAATVEEAISDTESSVDYVWIIHADARPRPDALGALVSEVERHEAGLGASKLLKAGTSDALESIGSATDVFGEPYSGLDSGEVDLQQYDVVREVAYVDPVSMLVRRDLARGLGGLDTSVPPGAAGLDFSQRARLAGSAVIIVPSSEVYHQAKCVRPGQGWKERAGRLRAMLVAYRPLTLAWVLPVAFLVGLLDSILNLLLLRWRPLASYLATWVWNIFRLPSTFSRRRRANSIRSVGDEELFRFQTAGSVRLRDVGGEIAGRLLSMFDDDQALSQSARRVFRSPGIVGAVLAVLIVLLATRGFLFSGVPNGNFSFPFEPPSISLRRFLGGWNEAGLGSPVPVHPITGFSGLVAFLWFGAEGAARTLLTVGFGFSAVVGMGRLLGRLGLRGPGRYLSGIVALAGPGTALLTGAGWWSSLAAAAVLPWALRSVFIHPAEQGRSRLGYIGWAFALGWIAAAISPLILLAPVLGALIWSAQGGRRSKVELAIASGLGGLVAISFLSGDTGWLTDATRRTGFDPGIVWAGLLLVTALPLFLDGSRHRRIAGIGGIFALGGLFLTQLGLGGPGVEEALLVIASVGAAILVGVALDKFERRVVTIIAAIGALAILLGSIGVIMDGRLGLPAGDVNEDLAFAASLTEDGQARRVLFISGERERVPGESRPGPGIWYRVLDGEGSTTDEIWLPPQRPGDRLLADAIVDISSGGLLRPGTALAEFGIGWVVSSGPETPIDEALNSQLDIVPLPLDSELRVYENPAASPLAVSDDGVVWTRSGLGFEGEPAEGSVLIASNFTTSWEPDGVNDDWSIEVGAGTGRAFFDGHPVNVVLGYVSMILLVLAAGLIGWGRAKR